MSEVNQQITEHKKELSQIGQKHKLDLLILYGSQATGKINSQSDVDIAIYRRGGINSAEYLKIYSEINQVLKGFEVDVKSLHNTNPLFQFFVTNDGVLLFGNPLFFAEIKASSYQNYMDSQSLFVLEKNLNKKGINKLLGRYD